MELEHGTRVNPMHCGGARASDDRLGLFRPTKDARTSLLASRTCADGEVRMVVVHLLEIKVGPPWRTSAKIDAWRSSGASTSSTSQKVDAMAHVRRREREGGGFWYPADDGPSAC